MTPRLPFSEWSHHVLPPIWNISALFRPATLTIMSDITSGISSRRLVSTSCTPPNWRTLLSLRIPLLRLVPANSTVSALTVPVYPDASSKKQHAGAGCCFSGETPAFSADGLLLNLTREEIPDYDAGHKGRPIQVS